MKPIWFFVGMILLVMGLIILASGIYSLAYPPVNKTILSEHYPDIWWGCLMSIVGLIYVLANKGKKV